ncbi:MAG: exodeoxyribonuclease III [Bacteroidota bacterium]|nr:exodeoxyribonuclease III [Bacteroidota bacterium]
MKIISYNVNGIRSAINKGFVDFLKSENPDIVCLQEIKANIEDIDQMLFENLGYNCYWFSAQKKGYSGVGILSKTLPIGVEIGIKHSLFDNEGRVLSLTFDKFTVMSCYFPSGTTGDIRQEIKYEFLATFFKHIENYKTANPNQGLIICGDYNICHREIDIHDPIGNKNSSGFLPEERAWMDQWFNSGMTDSFRWIHKEPHHYTWWSFRTAARSRNKGWRIDYISVSEQLKNQIKNAGILNEYVHSDHCGSFVEIKDL